MILPALIALVVDTIGTADAASGVGTSARRGRLHELANRLGVAQREAIGGDLRSRMEWALDHGADIVAMWMILDMLSVLDEDLRNWRRHHGITTPLWHLRGRPSGIMLPPEGLATPYDPLVPWLAREIGKSVREGRGPPTNDYWRQNVEGLGAESYLQRIATSAFQYLRPFHDWWMATSPDLQAMDIATAIRASEDWHRELAAAADKKVSRADVKRLEVQNADQVLHRWPDGWVLVELRTPQDLDIEGRIMGHCIGGGSYDEAVSRRDRFKFTSLRDPGGVPRVTMEWGWAFFNVPVGKGRSGEGWFAHQVKGAGNSYPRGDLARRAVRALRAVQSLPRGWGIEGLSIAPDRALRWLGTPADLAVIGMNRLWMAAQRVPAWSWARGTDQDDIQLGISTNDHWHDGEGVGFRIELWVTKAELRGDKLWILFRGQLRATPSETTFEEVEFFTPGSAAALERALRAALEALEGRYALQEGNIILDPGLRGRPAAERVFDALVAHLKKPSQGP
jgi:hypothetical protein